jgi:methyl-accepting chemotaxis protein
MIVGAEKIMDALPDSISKSEVGVSIQQTLDVIQDVLKEADQFAGQMAEIAGEADRAAEQAEAYIARAEQMAEQAEQLADQAEQVMSGCGFLSLCGCEQPKAQPKAQPTAPNAQKASIQMARI